MPNKTKKESNASSEQLNRRRSARLAGLDKEKPAESPKATKKEPAKKKSKKVVSDKMSKGDVELDSSIDHKNHNDQNDEVKGEDDLKKNEDNEIVNDEVKKDEGDFVVVKKNEVPSPDSDEVKEAIKAQGEDGELLVNFVQVTHDDVPDAKVVPATVNGICTTNNLDTEKTEEPQQLADEPKVNSV